MAMPPRPLQQLQERIIACTACPRLVADLDAMAARLPAPILAERLGFHQGRAAQWARAAGATYVAIITDGNGRWAERRGLPALAGHEAGADTVKARLRDAVDLVSPGVA